MDQEQAAGAGHFYGRRPVHLCTDDRDDEDEGPPNWTNWSGFVGVRGKVGA